MLGGAQIFWESAIKPGWAHGTSEGKIPGNDFSWDRTTVLVFLASLSSGGHGCGTAEFHDFGTCIQTHMWVWNSSISRFLYMDPDQHDGVDVELQNSMVLDHGSRSKPSPLFPGPVVRGQLSRQLSRHCSLPGKSTGKTWRWVKENPKYLSFSSACDSQVSQRLEYPQAVVFWI